MPKPGGMDVLTRAVKADVDSGIALRTDLTGSAGQKGSQPEKKFAKIRISDPD